ncbi:MAG: hypothetical protein IJA79_06060 [Desulfovibrio sp.]|nr:hypothetical protein [Desulfovibrio sp.]
MASGHFLPDAGSSLSQNLHRQSYATAPARGLLGLEHFPVGIIQSVFLIEALCVSIHTPPTLPRIAGQAREKRGFPAKLDKSRLLTARASACVRQSDAIFNDSSL